MLVEPDEGAFEGEPYVTTGPSYVMTFTFVPERESMTISRCPTVDHPGALWHVTMVLVVHEDVKHNVDPRVTVAETSEPAKLIPRTLTPPPPVSAVFFGLTKVTAGES